MWGQVLLVGWIAVFALASVISFFATPLIAVAAQHPDFSGIWIPAPGQARASGFGGAPKDLPFTEEGKRRVDEYQKLIGPERANPGAYCVDYGVPTMMRSPGSYPLEFIQKPDQLTIILETEGETRRIYLGDRRVPPERRLLSRDGYSEGRWEGKTLVVKTTDLLDGVDQTSNPHSENATIEERFSIEKGKDNAPLMLYTAEITDPMFYTKPFKFDLKFVILKDGFIFPYRCPDEFWYKLLDARRKQLREGKPVTAKMSDIYKAREAKE